MFNEVTRNLPCILLSCPKIESLAAFLEIRLQEGAGGFIKGIWCLWEGEGPGITLVKTLLCVFHATLP